MTNNQINYARVLEDARHNLETEKVSRHQAHSARITAEAAAANAAEQERSHRESEKINWYSAFEANRSNIAKENETKRHNTESERLDQISRDTERFNAQTAYNRQVAESAHWARQDSVAQHNAESQRISALASSMQASVAQQRANEEERANLVREAQNRTIYSETVRHNKEEERTKDLGRRNQTEHWRNQDRIADYESVPGYVKTLTGLAGSIARILR
uniref:Putative ORF1 n=1 Tax=Rodent picobirnavirus TaxID=2863997 RepID=A0A8K1HI32_9VIRU|nr:putative ORF1 [Rodent picobirnavirus]